MKTQRILPPTVLLIALLAMLGLRFLLPGPDFVPSPWNLFGVIFLLAGIGLDLAGDRLFRQARTTIRPFEESSSLVTGGIFRLSRNPMYLGYALILAGAALLLGSLSPLTVVLAFVIVIEALFIRPEETMLEQKFGQAYLGYKKKVRRWL